MKEKKIVVCVAIAIILMLVTLTICWEITEKIKQQASSTTITNNVKIGDYVEYNPDVSNLKSEIIKDLNESSGYKEEQNKAGIEQIDYLKDIEINQENLKWRIYDVQDGKIRLISDKPTTSSIYLAGYNGYNNEVYLINDICSELYSKAGISTSKGLNIEDIQGKFKDSFLSTSEFNLTTNINNKNYYPLIFEKENREFNNSTLLGMSEQNEIINGVSKGETENLIINSNTVKDGVITLSSFKDYKNKISKYSEMLLGKTSYCLASRAISSIGNTNSLFGMYVINNNNTITIDDLYTSNGQEFSKQFSFRPIVTLNSNITIKPCDGDNSITNMHTIITK